MKKTHIILLIIFLVACSDHMGNWEYNLVKKKFPSLLVDHFPDEIMSFKRSNFSYSYGYELPRDAVTFTFYQYDIKEKDIETLIKRLEKESIETYTSEDETLMVVFVSGKERQGLLNTSRDTTLIPIPYFDPKIRPNSNKKEKMIFDNNTISGLQKGFKIFVLDSKQHSFEYALPEHIYLPFSWRTGFSKGISINKEKKIIIYWAIIW